MLHSAVEIVRPEGAVLAALLPIGAKHEVIDDELAAALEQLAQTLAAVGPVEDVLLLDPDPGERAPLLVQLVALSGQLLLLRQESAAGGQPLFLRDDLVLVFSCFAHAHSLCATEAFNRLVKYSRFGAASNVPGCPAARVLDVKGEGL
jgi:hypothetical protein